MKEITKQLLNIISDDELENDGYKGAYNIREDGGCVGRMSSDNIKIENKTDAPGLVITIAPNTKGEKVSIPACVTHGDVDDLVYNDFHVGSNSDVIIMAGCGVHTETGEPARHSGIHNFYLEKNSKVKYIEKHVGTGKGAGIRSIDPVTNVFLAEGAVLEMDTSQIGGVDKSVRTTTAKLDKQAKLIIKEKILTEQQQYAATEFNVELNGDDCGVDLMSRAVAKDNSTQVYHSVIKGNAKCTGHSECDAIISENGKVDAAPELHARNTDAALIHEAAIGKIAGEQILKLQTLGLTEKEAEATIIEGFLN